MLSQWKEAFSLLGCDISDNPTKRGFPSEKKQDGLFLPISTYSFVPKRRERRKASLAMAGTLSPRAICAPKSSGTATCPPTHPAPRPRWMAWKWVATLGHQGAWKLLQTKQIHFKSPLQPEHFILVKSLSCPNSLTAKTNIIYLLEGRVQTSAWFFFLAKVTAQPVTWRKRGKKKLREGCQIASLEIKINMGIISKAEIALVLLRERKEDFHINVLLVLFYL